LGIDENKYLYLLQREMSVRMSVNLGRCEPNSHLTSCFDITREKFHTLHVQYIQAVENSVAHLNFGAFSRLFRKS